MPRASPREGDRGLIDLHSHVLPGIDDGASTVAEALELARTAAAGGTRVLAATPHLRADHPTVVPSELGRRCEDLARRLADAEIPVEVVPGGEVDLDWAAAASDDDLRLASYGQRGTDLLVETPYGDLAPDFEERALALAEKGFRILLAHPERNPTLRHDQDRLARLRESGLLVQLTARSVVPAGRPSAAHRAAIELLEQGLVDVLASDAHSPGGAAPPDLALGVAAARALVGARAERLASDAPGAVLAGAPLPSDERALLPVGRGGGLTARWLVDGMNVVGSRPTGWWRDRPGAVRALVERLHEFSAATGEAVAVVFDGKPVDVPAGAGAVEVRFATRPGRNAADDDIARRVEHAQAPGALRVVTSDASLAERVARAGAEVVPAGSFLRRLDEAAGGG